MLKLNYVGNLPGDSSGATLVVDSDAGYCQASDVLRGNNPEGIETVSVRHPHHFAWLKEQVGHCRDLQNDGILIAVATPGKLLADRWGLEIPPWLTDQLILDAGLLQQDLPEGASSVAAGLLAPVLGNIPATLSTGALGGLAEKLSDTRVRAQLDAPALAAAWQSVLDGWGVNETRPWARDYCDRLAKNPEKLWADLTTWRLLRNYPDSALDYALDPAAAAFVRGLPDDAATKMRPSPDGQKVASDQIELAISAARASVATRQRFEILLKAVSGELVEEFDALEEMLGRAEFEVTRDDLAEMRRRFAGCDGLSETRLAGLDLLVPPPTPSMDISGKGTAAEWKQWALEQYLPYRWWQIQRRLFDPKIEEPVARFSEWYCENHSLVHADADESAMQLLARWREQILGDEVSLLLLVDNLPWFFWPLLERALAKAGLHRHEFDYSFAPLPSHTAVCKPRLISGKLDATGSEYLKQLQTRSADEWKGRSVHYLASVGQLGALPADHEPCVVLLNYLAADETLHKDAEATGSTWPEQLDLLFGNLAKAVGDFARRVSKGGRAFGLYVITDHGATMILPEEKKAPESQLVQGLFEDEKHRSATFSRSKASEIPSNLWSLGFRLEHPWSDEVHFIPRGHSTVASSGQKLTFMHGGATPEEVMVPGGLFRLYQAAWTTPGVRFIDLELAGGKARFYIKRIVMLSFEIQNLNSEAARLEGIQLQPAVGEVRHFDAMLIPSGGTSQGTVSFYFSDKALNTERITVTFDLRIGEVALPRAIDVPVLIASATTGGIDLKNLLS